MHSRLLIREFVGTISFQLSSQFSISVSMWRVLRRFWLAGALGNISVPFAGKFLFPRQNFQTIKILNFLRRTYSRASIPRGTHLYLTSSLMLSGVFLRTPEFWRWEGRRKDETRIPFYVHNVSSFVMCTVISPLDVCSICSAHKNMPRNVNVNKFGRQSIFNLFGETRRKMFFILELILLSPIESYCRWACHVTSRKFRVVCELDAELSSEMEPQCSAPTQFNVYIKHTRIIARWFIEKSSRFKMRMTVFR